VFEHLGFEPAGEGEHLYVQIKKRGENSHWVAEKLAAFFGVKPMDVGLSGKKDRHAETTQWFSIYLPGKHLPEKALAPDWPQFIEKNALNIEVLTWARHPQKLRLGTHPVNSFGITLRDIDDAEAMCRRCQQIAEHGVPNYFGEQRFGREGSNLKLAAAWLEAGEKIKHRGKRGMVMSAARAYLFNRVLSLRVEQGCWTELLDGDISVDDGSPSGPLWGRGRRHSQGRSLELEQGALAALQPWCEGLEHVGLKQESRSLVLKPRNFSWRVEENNMHLGFDLSTGQFATSVLREIARLLSEA
jgi:tRNA pseudouridine13 synthase